MIFGTAVRAWGVGAAEDFMIVPAGVTVRAVEMVMIERGLARHEGSVAVVAEELGISETTVRRRLRAMARRRN